MTSNLEKCLGMSLKQVITTSKLRDIQSLPSSGTDEDSNGGLHGEMYPNNKTLM